MQIPQTDKRAEENSEADEHSVLLAHLRRRRSVIRSRHLLFNVIFAILLALIPAFVLYLLLRSPLTSPVVSWLVVGLLCILFCLLFVMHLRAEAGQAAKRPRFREQLRSDLLDGGLLADVLNAADPSDLLDSSLRPSQQELADEGIELPGDAVQRIDFLLLHYRALNWSRMQARRSRDVDDNAGKAVLRKIDGQLSQLSYGECICLIDVLIDYLDSRSGEVNGDG